MAGELHVFFCPTHYRLCRVGSPRDPEEVSMPEYVRVFAYGTLTDPSVVSRVLGRYYSPHQTYRSTVKGYERRRAGFYYAVPKEGAEIRGVVLTGLTLADLEKLDRYEGYPHLYGRVEVDRVGNEPVYLYVGASIARGW